MINEKLPKGSAEHIYMLNKIKILNFIYEEREISRAEIARKTGISAPTVSRIVDSLIHKEKLATDVGFGGSSGGRRPVIVRFDGSNSFVIGIDWGRTHINGVLADLDANILFELDIPSDPDTSFNEDFKNVKKLIEHLITKSGIKKNELSGIGVAVAGYVNKNTGIVEFSPNFKWKNANIQEPLAKNFHVPVMVDNVCRVAAMGEYLYGTKKMLNDFIFFNIGHGIGSGILYEGQPFWGHDGFSGEIGHTLVKPLYGEDRKCSCGKINCLESFSSGRGIEETMKKKMDNHPNSMIHMLVAGKKERVTTELIAKAAKAGDNLSLEILRDAGQLVGVSLAIFANVINPAAIILGGKVSLSGDVFISAIQETFATECLPNTVRKIPIIKSELIGQAAVKGSISLVLRQVLNLNLFNT
jgi:glucokinase-like ROK family protein